MSKYFRKSILVFLAIFILMNGLLQFTGLAHADPLVGTEITVSPDGTKDYTSIQEAIDNASTGDTIYVYNGTYYEHLTIDKTLTLTGEQNTTTIIDGQHEEMNIVTITADMVNFSGFTLINGSNFVEPTYFSISIESQNTKIYSNIFNNSTFGISVTTNNNAIYNNSFLSILEMISPEYCIYLDNADNNTIYSNYMYDNESYFGYGILLEESTNNYIHDNLIMNCMVGLGLLVSPHNILKNNNMSDNIINFGILGDSISDFYNDIDTSNLVDGLHLYYYINQSDITINSSSRAGTVYCINCTNMTIINSNLHSVDSGIAFYQTTNSRIENCTISNCDIGVDLFDDAHNNTIENNIISNCDNNIAIGSNSINNVVNNNHLKTTINNPGLVIRDSNYNTITNNDFLDCRTGMYIWNSKYINIQNNTINHSILVAISLFYDAYNCTIAHNHISKSNMSITFDDGAKFNNVYAPLRRWRPLHQQHILSQRFL